MSLSVASDGFELLSGELKTFTVTCDSGRGKRCAFCPRCGTRIYHQVSPEELSLKPGTLDDTVWLNPTEHYWTKRKQSWVPMPDDAVSFVDDG